MSYSIEIFDLFKSVALQRGLNEQFIGDLFRDFKVTNYQIARTTRFGIKVIGLNYPLEFHSDDYSKVFELKGINTQYKTTTIILMGILLGCDWKAQNEFMSNYKLESQIEEIDGLFDDPQIYIELYIESDLYNLRFIKNDKNIQIINNDSVIYTKQLINTELDMEEYRVEASKLFKVQFISKGRDFVTQVHNEILMDIKKSIDYLAHKGKEILSNFMANRQKKVYVKSLREYENELVLLNSLRNVILDFQNKYHEINDITIFDHYDKLPGLQEKLMLLKQREEEVKNDLIKHEKELSLLKEKYGVEKLSNYLYPPVEWTNPIRNIKKITSESVLELEGNDIIPFTVEINGNPRLRVTRAQDLRQFLSLVEVAQQDALVFYDNKHDYIRISELEKLIKKESNELSELNNQLFYTSVKIEKIQQLNINEDWDLSTIISRVAGIKKLMLKLSFSQISEVDLILNEIETKITEITDIIEQIKNSNNKNDYLPYEILNSILFEFSSLKSLLIEKGVKQGAGNNSIRETAQESEIYENVVTLFNNIMKDRCKYYYTVSDNNVNSVELRSYDFESRMLTTNEGDEISAKYGLSGGIDSAMTVRSLASCPSDAMYGTVVLVDEWGDVSEKLAHTVYDTLTDLPQFALGLFVKVVEEDQAKIHSIKKVH